MQFWHLVTGLVLPLKALTSDYLEISIQCMATLLLSDTPSWKLPFFYIKRALLIFDKTLLYTLLALIMNLAWFTPRPVGFFCYLRYIYLNGISNLFLIISLDMIESSGQKPAIFRSRLSSAIKTTLTSSLESHKLWL